MESRALAPEGMYFQQPAFPRRLKPHPYLAFHGTAKRAAEKLDTEGGGGFTPPHNASRINAGFSHGGTSSSNFTGNPEFFRSLFTLRHAFRTFRSLSGLFPRPVQPVHNAEKSPAPRGDCMVAPQRGLCRSNRMDPSRNRGDSNALQHNPCSTCRKLRLPGAECTYEMSCPNDCTPPERML
jgi:hypothetical protein